MFEKNQRRYFCVCLIFVFHILFPLRGRDKRKTTYCTGASFPFQIVSMYSVYPCTYFYVLTYKNIRRYTLQTNPDGRHASVVISARNNSIVVLPPQSSSTRRICIPFNYQLCCLTRTRSTSSLLFFGVSRPNCALINRLKQNGPTKIEKK